MCVICTGKYSTNCMILRTCHRVEYIPKELRTLMALDCSFSKIKSIPKELINLQHLCCCNTKINYIPKELINLNTLDCNNTNVSHIPKELIKLEKLYCSSTKVNYIPRELINVRFLGIGNRFINQLECQEFINKLFVTYKLSELYKLNKKMPTLWKIAEYYTSQKYHPDYILNYE